MTTNKEKIYMLKDSISYLYEKEGRSKSYIARLLSLERKTLTHIINNDWQLQQARGKRYLKPSNKKFLNKHRNLIKSRLDNDYELNEIAKELGVSRDYLTRTIIANDNILKKSSEDRYNRITRKSKDRRDKMRNSFITNNPISKIEGEEWKPILGYEGYFVSNMGRVKSYKSTYNAYQLLTPYPNILSGYHYVKIGKENLSVARLVGFNFIEGYSDKNNTIEHKDNNRNNNKWWNLKWVSQSENNLLAYKKGRKVVKCYSRNKKFQSLTIEGKYNFKTIRAFARWAGVSESQAHRYISGETPYNKSISFNY